MQLSWAKPEQLRCVLELLRANGLPEAGVPEWFRNFLIVKADDRIAGVIGYERYGSYALLRSAVVASDHRGSGVGAALVGGLLAELKVAGVSEVYLLTTTAEAYFLRFGFRRIERASVPEPLQASEELAHACPASATVMLCMVSH